MILLDCDLVVCVTLLDRDRVALTLGLLAFLNVPVALSLIASLCPNPPIIPNVRFWRIGRVRSYAGCLNVRFWRKGHMGTGFGVCVSVSAESDTRRVVCGA